MEKKLLVFDFFAGTGSSTQAFKDDGHTVITFELNSELNPTHAVDMLEISSSWLIEKYGRPDFVWASPPCTAFSVASIGHHWTGGSKAYIPKTEAAVHNQELVKHTIRLINDLQPRYGYLIENPRGLLRKLDPVQDLPRTTVTYCQYGDFRMKPTDLWGGVKNWTPRPMCKNGDNCHTSAPRGSSTGTQGVKGAKLRSMVPYGLGLELLECIKESINNE